MVNKNRLDSPSAPNKNGLDSLSAPNKNGLDSLSAPNKNGLDSPSAPNKNGLDSLSAPNKNGLDSLSAPNKNRLDGPSAFNTFALDGSAISKAIDHHQSRGIAPRMGYCFVELLLLTGNFIPHMLYAATPFWIAHATGDIILADMVHFINFWRSLFTVERAFSFETPGGTKDYS
ncbi:hypothetical protein BJ742DRAFT_740403 [Cladochytrium replicatum]|nr:hypothetical protein BJ742DRAFT_740403 [Cladochytrium replicatum]